jgi:hypothetical protein
VMSSAGESRSSEVGGLQGASQSLGSSLGTALIGAILLAGLTTGFHDRIREDPAVPDSVQKQIISGSEQGVPMISREAAQATVEEAGLAPGEAETVLARYEAAQIDALKQALLAAAMFALVALWFAGNLPRAPLAVAAAERRSQESPPRAALT